MDKIKIAVVIHRGMVDEAYCTDPSAELEIYDLDNNETNPTELLAPLMNEVQNGKLYQIAE